MFKKILIIFVASIFLIGAVASIDAFAYGKNNKNPFKLIWQKLFDHEERITDLEEQPPMAFSTRVVTNSIIVSKLASESVLALCDDDEIVTGGGFEHFNEFDAQPLFTTGSYPVTDDSGKPIGWEASALNRTNRDNTFIVYVVCASSSM